VALFIPFIQHLMDEGLAKRNIKYHGNHLDMLGGEIQVAMWGATE